MEFRNTIELADRNLSLDEKIKGTSDVIALKEKHPLHDLMQKQIQQNDTIIQQNEQIMQQNERIIQLLQRRSSGYIT